MSQNSDGAVALSSPGSCRGFQDFNSHCKTQVSVGEDRKPSLSKQSACQFRFDMDSRISFTPLLSQVTCSTTLNSDLQTRYMKPWACALGRPHGKRASDHFCLELWYRASSSPSRSSPLSAVDFNRRLFLLHPLLLRTE